ncbi:phage baseplate assembly protein domain-containing protein [Herminiimonas contaminans]|uniref:Phage baseplate assembly protein n=1 Tax=Herminiimonas contaminans TaxID=1111140 RepID=A0ABS0EXT8_9BURK|nr:phage baseplate assembly protein [Herminiimonas contaminans]MBF8179665.1 phage baseplate assembly protein [Herminiimonas contaminans]
MSDDLARLLEPLRNKIRLLAGRAVVSLLKDVVTVQVKLLDGEPKEVEMFQQYGFRSRPLPGAEGVNLSGNGIRDLTYVFCVDDRRYQLDLLESGEAALYDHLGKHVHLKADGSIVIKADTEVLVDAPFLKCTGQIIDNCNSNSVSMQRMREKYNAHVHHENDAGGNTGGPSEVME